jgi:ribosomal protein S5
MVEVKEELQVHSPGLYEEAVVKVNRCAKVVKGGRRFSFSALVVGDRHGSVGIGWQGQGGAVGGGEGRQDTQEPRPREPQKGSIEHAVLGRFGAAQVRLLPAAPGTGIIAGATVRAVPKTRACATSSPRASARPTHEPAARHAQRPAGGAAHRAGRGAAGVKLT